MTENILEKIKANDFYEDGVNGEIIIKVEDIEKIISEYMNDDWIPTNKAIPKKEGCYLVTFRYGKKVRVIGYGSCQMDVLGRKIGFGWYDLSSAEYFDNTAIMAWRPLPEPYRPKKDNAGIKPSEYAKTVIEVLQSEKEYFIRMMQSGEWDEMEDEIYEYARNIGSEEARAENRGEIITAEDIDNFPTAYDVDKVVGQLDKMQVYQFQGKLPDGRICHFADAIEIVKAGGVNGD